jgi:hypothetical protein
MEMMINLDSFAGGALAEQLNTELAKVITNIYDPNTDPAKVRKLTLTISFKANHNRSVAAVSIQAKSSLAPIMPLETNIMIDRDLKSGKVVAAEIGNQAAGQIEMEMEEPAPKGDTVINLKNVKNK